MADVHCMRDLIGHHVRWNYVINMPGQQFPLKSNLEMVRILKLYNGANDVLGDVRSKYVPRRYLFKHHVMMVRNTS
ncbi:beta-1,3-galactosyl-O-glycosyl-glycoprotein beta-1,6-N-acetylglucosaminyltransferase-like [Elysia marginata]|uniref:Beta-1,3-galactosyl-O-glycosyl-glycoprotein beta-1,6-N-acetylglucosaminyltransferase-like n=1 Tax=Elysia marginata TaxID=1093978 RepID=A0AAV4EQ44_9GAST|nr:beta-1,3-galactosyl-O-glycosyl-glycoprotein beta-1,6-N-acetylglucosaminyltransferase-like [Elysia marginata]